MKLTAYNPGVLSRDDAVQGFVARQTLLARVLEDLRKEGPAHRVLVGQRGMGKTSLLRRLYFAVLEDPAIAARWVPVAFREEQYNVASLSDLWLNCLDALAEAARPEHMAPTELTSLERSLERLAQTPKAQLEREAFAMLEAEISTRARGMCLLIDNVDLVLDRLSVDERWKLREVLSGKPLLVVGGCVAPHPSMFTYDAPFYDFFRLETLRGLDDVEVRTMLRSLSSLRETPDVVRVMAEDPGRITTLRILSGGNPRAIVLVHQLLASSGKNTVVDDVTALLDMCTPLYKARFEALSAQSQVVVDAVCRAWDPVTAARVAADTRIDVNAVSSQLNRLVNDGLIEQVKYPGGRKGFQVAERLFNVWYLMRLGGRVRRRLLWLVEFLRAFYGSRRVSEDAAALAKGGGQSPDLLLAYAAAAQDDLTRRALELQAVEAIVAQAEEPRRALAEALDLNGGDQHLARPAERVAMIKEIKRLLAKQPPLEDGTPVADAVLSLVHLPCSVRHALAKRLALGQETKLLNKSLATRLKGFDQTMPALYRAIVGGRVESALQVDIDDVKALRDLDRAAFDEGLCCLSYQAVTSAQLLAILQLVTESRDEVVWYFWLERAQALGDVALIDRILRSTRADRHAVTLWERLFRMLEARFLPCSFAIASHLLETGTSFDEWQTLSAMLGSGTPRAEPKVSGGVPVVLNLGFVPWEDTLAVLQAGGDWPLYEVAWLARFSTQAGYARQAADFMDQQGLSDMHRPMREALLSAALGPDHLLTVAPEIREPAQKILTWITYVRPAIKAMGLSAVDQPTPRPATAKRQRVVKRARSAQQSKRSEPRSAVSKRKASR